MSVVIILAIILALIYRRQFVGLVKHKWLLLITAILLIIFFRTLVGYGIAVLALLFALPILNKLFNYIERKIQQPNAKEEMSKEEAREILEVTSQATREEIAKAFKNKIKQHHPDHGGSSYFAKKVTKARDKLLKTKR